MNYRHVENALKTIRGQFYPDQFSSQLYMDSDSIPQNYLVYFHERFHYLQNIFTPYGHLKWGCYRSFTAEIIDAWIGLTEKYKKKKKIPAFSYIEDEDLEGLKILGSIFLQDMALQFSSITESDALSEELLQRNEIQREGLVPSIVVSGKEFILNGIDIIESFAKFEEAVLAYLVEDKPLSETINPSVLLPRYFIALYYFIEVLGDERLHEFPVVCELALAISHLPKVNDDESMKKYHPSWRFIKIVDCIKNNPQIKLKDIRLESSFWEYTDEILRQCEFDSWEELWKPAEVYANQTDLSMAQEMLDAIKYKKTYPWALSYPMNSLPHFISAEFNRFHPLFTITNDGVFYSLDKVSSSELLFENHFQALALQISGRMSKRCIYPDMLQCGYSYFGLNVCPHQQRGECDGHICSGSELPAMKMDESKNIIEGCTFEIVLNIMGTSIHEIEITSLSKKYGMGDLADAARRIKSKCN